MAQIGKTYSISFEAKRQSYAPSHTSQGTEKSAKNPLRGLYLTLGLIGAIIVGKGLMGTTSPGTAIPQKDHHKQEIVQEEEMDKKDNAASGIEEAIAKETAKEISKAPSKEGQEIGHMVKVRYGSLKGSNFKDLYGAITGVYGKVPKDTTINPEKHMLRLWNYKMEKSDNPEVNAYVSERIQPLVEKGMRPMTFSQYRTNLQNIINDYRKNLDWDKVLKVTRLDATRRNVLRNIVNTWNADDLIAVTMTEMLPGKKGERNRKVLEVSMNTLGEGFYFLPSFGDNLLSYGPYQVTDGAMRNGVGAKRIEKALPENLHIPDHVKDFTPNDHHRFEMGHLIAGLAESLNRLDGRQLNVLSAQYRQKHIDIVELMGTINYHPRSAYQAQERWLDNKAKKEYRISCSERNKHYADKMGENRNWAYRK